MPAASRSRSSRFGRRPAATRICVPSIVSSPASLADIDLHARQRAAHLRDLHAGAQRDALAGERVEHDASAFRIVAGKRRRRFEHRDLGAEPAKRLRQFEAGRARADDDEMARTIGEIEHGLAGEIRHVGKARDRRQRRRRAGGDDEAARFDVEAVDRDGLRRSVKRAFAFDDAHAQTVETLARILRRDRGDDVAHVGAHRGEIDAEARAL